ncbi:bone morphogenetic protein 2-like [Harmonia axyridis]|uniref:bone morphogenetic protein 2-like n=1 Tax=Harmonia axyridis TaxID=115357 RepID=UPI001E278A3B|nr:bone morphogenetic protein 2-like [Harmonia axyridis]
MFSRIWLFVIFAISPAYLLNESVSANTTVGVKIYNISENVPYNISADGKTYFFKYNTNNNQFRIYNRVSVNPLVTQNTSDILLEKRKTTKSNKSNMNELRKFEAFLDEEWNYSSGSSQLNKSDLPFQIYPFLYNAIVQKASMKLENGERVPDITKIVFNKHKNDSMILNLKLGKINPSHSILNAELHFYWHVPEKSKFFKNSCVLRLYEVENEQNDTLASQTPDIHKLLNVIYVSKAQTGWQMFRISRKSIESWANLTEELRLLISISEANQVNSTTVFNDTYNTKKMRTFLILRISDTESDNSFNKMAPKNDSTGYRVSHKYCSRTEFYLDFRKLHWSNFIIAPEGFMAYDCQGKCTRHNVDMFSNHLKMLTTFQDVDKRTRSPCCVGVDFYSLPIMFYDHSGNVVMKIYKNLIVANCGCR